MLLTQVECTGCVEVYPDYCEACKAVNRDIALNTKIEPTSGVCSIREDGDTYIVENDDIHPTALARISPYNKDEAQKASDAVMIALAWEMWELILCSAKTNPDDFQAAGIVGRADAMFKQLMQEVESLV